ncbi:MAG TPA: WecB/TagA/CpsF family glycosyltransferase [Candidatus Nanoarchaeia archaeon]|nr:N-acetylglucosaminyldiphosphoundecaprenol N-acetyl-beta-D-mannosaminyltransferase [uncultured archaeon]
MPRILNVRFDNLTLEEILEKIKKAVESGKKLHIITLNTEMIMTAQKDSEFKKVIAKADLVIPESFGLQLAWQHQKTSSKGGVGRLISLMVSGFKTMIGSGLKDPLEIIPGADLATILAGMAQEFGYKLFLLGGQTGVADEAAATLRVKFPKLQAKALAGGNFFGDFPQEITEKINSWEADILLVALGHPRQEKWIAAHLSYLNVKVAMGVGGAFDFLSGALPRAPKLVRNLGLEWAFRLLVQPRRAKRQKALLRFLRELLRSK